MNKLLLPLFLSLAAVTSCATTAPPTASASSPAWITPEQAILLAANAAPRGAPGTFAMKVQATGTQNNQIYLNSQQDYRDQRNLTVALTPSAAEQLRARLGADPLTAMKGRTILVTGDAIRTKIYFVADGKMTDKYYYQTHVNVREAGQIVIE